MKRTVFRFDLRLREADQSDQFDRIKAMLLAVQGVVQVEGRLSNGDCGCNIHVEFADSEAAKKLHRILMSRLMKTPNLEITSVTTVLTDVFDE